jgi:hypothetical protein
MTKPVAPPSALPEPASEEEVTAFLDWLHKQRKKIPRHLDQAALGELIPLPPRFRDSMEAIGLRIIMDMVRGPASRTAQKPRGDAPAARGSGPAAKRTAKPRAPAPRKKAAGTTARRTRGKSGKK